MQSMPDVTIDQILANRSQIAAEAPQWLDDNRIVFVSGLGGDPALWSVAAGGGFPQRLTPPLGGTGFMASRLARVSPDKRWLTCVAETDGTPEVWLWSAAGGPARQLTRLGATINALAWAPDSTAVAVSCNRNGSYDIYRINLDGTTVKLTNSLLNEVFPAWTPDGSHILFVRLDDRWADHDIIAISAAGGGAERLVVRDTDYFDYRLGRTFGYPQVSPDGQHVLFRSYRSGYMNYWLAPLAGGEPRPLALAEADQTDAVWSPDGQRVAYCSNHNGTLALCVAEVAGAARPRAVVAPASGICAQPEWSPDGKRIAYLFQSPAAPLDLWVVPSAGGAATQLTDSRLNGAERYLIAPDKIAYPTFDGRPIHAYLYRLPPDGSGRKRPCLIWAHGGPSSQWSDEYYEHLQYFALRGYVVLAPNVRGSTGYGRAFEDLNNQDWGYGDLQDVLAGVAYLKTLDGVDPDRMAITGTSYGGYLTAAAVCFTQNVFRAAISASGYPDRVAMYYEQEQSHIKQMEFKFGPFETHRHIYEKCSPQRWAKQATTPCFVLNGEGLLPRSQGARNFALALEKEYKTVQYRAYPSEGYYVYGTANTRQMWRDMEAFLERYL